MITIEVRCSCGEKLSSAELLSGRRKTPRHGATLKVTVRPCKRCLLLERIEGCDLGLKQAREDEAGPSGFFDPPVVEGADEEARARRLKGWAKRPDLQDGTQGKE